MEFQGLYKVPATPDAVWEALHDPAVLQSAIPGCEEVKAVSGNTFQARTTLKVGPIKARFDGKVTIIEHAPPPGAVRACTLKGEGQGGAAGFARGEAELQLAPDGNGTALSYKAQATVGGRLAQIGQRLLDATAKSMADEFFASFAKLMGHEETSVPASRTAVVRPKPAADDGLGPQVWLVGLIGIVIILLIVFSIAL